MADFDTLKSWAVRDWTAQGNYREEMREDFAFHDGHQWSDSERTAMEETQRAAIIFNRVAPIIASVSGSEINNRTEVRFIPREIGDAKPNEVLTAGAEWFRDESNAEDEESQSFQDMLIVGIGFTETYLDFDADEEGAPRTRRIDPVEMFWDCHAHRKGLEDRSRIGRVRQIPISEAKDMFPDVEVSDLNACWLDVTKDNPATYNNINGDEYRDGENVQNDTNPNTVTIVQMQWRERERVVEFIDPATGQKKEVPKSGWDRIAKTAPIMPEHRVISRMVWKQAFLGNVLLGESEPCGVAPTFQAVTGHWDRKDKRFYGLLRSMKDPQRFANKWLSQTLHIISVNSKGGLIVEEGATSDMRALEESWAAADGITVVKDGAISAGKIQQKEGPQIPAALMGLTEFAISSIRDVSGVNMELMGMREAQQAGVLEYQRRQASMTTLAAYFDALRYYRKRQGEVILYFLQHWIAPTGRLVRIVRKDQEQYVPLAMEDDTRKYDVIVDDSPQAPNEKERTWSIVEKMLPLLMDAGLSLEDWADILEYSPLPASFAEKVRAKAEEAAAQPPEPNPMEEATLANITAQAEQRKADAMLKMAQAQSEGMPQPQEQHAADNPLLIQSAAAKDMSTVALNEAKTMNEMQKPQFERAKLLAGMMQSAQRNVSQPT